MGNAFKDATTELADMAGFVEHKPASQVTVGGGVNSNNVTAPNSGNFRYASSAPFTDTNAKEVYDNLWAGLDRTTQLSPTAALTSLGVNSQYGGAQVGNQMMVNAPNLNTAQDVQYTAAQNAYINSLANQASGNGPSLAEVTAKNQRDQNVGNMMAALGSQRGAGNTALGLRAAQSQAAAADQQAAAQAVTGRTQEELNAQQLLGGALQGARGQSQTTAQKIAELSQQSNLSNQGAYNSGSLANAQLMQAAGLANMGALNAANLQQGSMNQQSNMGNLTAEEQQNQLNDQQWNELMKSIMAQNQSDMASRQAYENLIGSEQEANESVNAGLSISNNNNAMGMAGAGIGALGSALMAFSDRRAKTNVRSGDRTLKNFLSALNVGDKI